jgi:hypothetical protein
MLRVFDIVLNYDETMYPDVEDFIDLTGAPRDPYPELTYGDFLRYFGQITMEETLEQPLDMLPDLDMGEISNVSTYDKVCSKIAKEKEFEFAQHATDLRNLAISSETISKNAFVYMEKNECPDDRKNGKEKAKKKNPGKSSRKKKNRRKRKQAEKEPMPHDQHQHPCVVCLDANADHLFNPW